MGIFYAELPGGITYFALLAALILLFRAATLAPWRRLREPAALSAWCASIIALPLVWRFRIPVASGLDLHLLGLSLFALMFGRQLAVIGIALSVAAYTATYDTLWSNLGVNLLLLAVLPACCSDMVLRMTQKYLPHHLFIYLFGNGFFGSMLVLSLTNLASFFTYRFLHGPVGITTDLIAYMLLLAWGEAFLIGFLLTIFTVYRPEWVLTFDDNFYLRGK